VRWWLRWLRHIDRMTLWEACKSQAPDMTMARDAFRVHMEMDHAYADMSEAEKREYVEALQ
jgi:hypothetical protein